MVLIRSGAIGVFVLPSRGIARSFNRWFNKNDHVLLAPRLAQSKIDAGLLTAEQQTLITRNYDDIVRLGAHARKKTIEKRMRKWFLGDDKAFAKGLDELEDDGSEPALSRTTSGTSLAPRYEAGPSRSPNSSIDYGRDPPPRFSQDDQYISSATGMSRGSVGSGSRQPMAYEQRRFDRLAHRSTPTSPLSAEDQSRSPPPFSSTDPHPSASRHEVVSPISSGPNDTDTIDSEVMRDLKDMYISRQEHQ